MLARIDKDNALDLSAKGFDAVDDTLAVPRHKLVPTPVVVPKTSSPAAAAADSPAQQRPRPPYDPPPPPRLA